MHAAAERIVASLADVLHPIGGSQCRQYVALTGGLFRNHTLRQLVSELLRLRDVAVCNPPVTGRVQRYAGVALLPYQVANDISDYSVVLGGTARFQWFEARLPLRFALGMAQDMPYDPRKHPDAEHDSSRIFQTPGGDQYVEERWRELVGAVGPTPKVDSPLTNLVVREFSARIACSVNSNPSGTSTLSAKRSHTSRKRYS